MENGCILVIDYMCSKFNVRCSGDEMDKRSCPVWGEVMAIEEYYSRKTELDRYRGV